MLQTIIQYLIPPGRHSPVFYVTTRSFVTAAFAVPRVSLYATATTTNDPTTAGEDGGFLGTSTDRNSPTSCSPFISLSIESRITNLVEVLLLQYYYRYEH